MKYKTLFRLLMKAVGVLLFVQGFVTLLSQAAWMIEAALQSGGNQVIGASGPVGLVILAAYAFQTGAGLYLFFGGKWVADMAIPSNRAYCPECGYELRGLVSDRCPECGCTAVTASAGA